MTTTTLTIDEMWDSVDRIHEATERMRVRREAHDERRRREDLLAGITPMERAVMDLDELADIAAVTSAMRAENDQLVGGGRLRV